MRLCENKLQKITINLFFIYKGATKASSITASEAITVDELLLLLDGALVVEPALIVVLGLRVVVGFPGAAVGAVGSGEEVSSVGAGVSLDGESVFGDGAGASGAGASAGPGSEFSNVPGSGLKLTFGMASDTSKLVSSAFCTSPLYLSVIVFCDASLNKFT
jgi:hypothetical protein